MSVLFLPVIWLGAYIIWEAFHWKARSKEVYALEELEPTPEQRAYDQAQKKAEDERRAA